MNVGACWAFSVAMQGVHWVCGDGRCMKIVWDGIEGGVVGER